MDPLWRCPRHSSGTHRPAQSRRHVSRLAGQEEHPLAGPPLALPYQRWRPVSSHWLPSLAGSLTDRLPREVRLHPAIPSQGLRLCHARSTANGNEITAIHPINAPTTPSNPVEAPAATLPDLSKINTQLSPPSNYSITSPTGSSTPSTLTQPGTPPSAFDEHAWETYFNQVKAEHTDVRLNALSRFKGTARDIDNLAREYSHATEYSEAMKPFKLWWDGQRGKVKLYEDKVKSLEMPSEDQAKRDRVAKGLPI